MFAQSLQGNNVEGAFVGRRENDVRGRSIVMGTQPICSGDAPSIAGYQSWKPVLRHRGGEIVADSLLVVEKFSRDNGANGVASTIFRPRYATTVSVEPRDGVCATRLQLTT
jgi:hypothetical protein